MIMMCDATNVWGAFDWDWCLFGDGLLGLLGKHVYFDNFLVWDVQERTG